MYKNSYKFNIYLKIVQTRSIVNLKIVHKFKNCIEPLGKFSPKLPDHPMLAPAARCIWQKFQVHCFFDIIFYIFNIVYIFKINNIIKIIYLSCIFKHNIKIKNNWKYNSTCICSWICCNCYISSCNCLSCWSCWLPSYYSTLKTKIFTHHLNWT